MISWNIGSSKELVLSGNRLGAIRQQAITANCDPWRQQAIPWASLDPGLCHNLVSLGHNNSGSWLSMMHNIACIIFFINSSYSNHTNYNVLNFICIQIQTWSIKNLYHEVKFMNATCIVLQVYCGMFGDNGMCWIQQNTSKSKTYAWLWWNAACKLLLQGTIYLASFKMIKMFSKCQQMIAHLSSTPWP